MTTIVQEIENQTDSVLTSNQLYRDYKDQWQYLLESYLGGNAYREGSHLTRYQTESGGEYLARTRSTYLDNHCQSVVSVYNSFLFREEPRRDFAVWGEREDVNSFLQDCDYDDRSLDAFMKDVSTWSSVFGHCWIIMTKPSIGAVTVADEVAAEVRPYLNLITPLVCLDWRYSRGINGRYSLSYLKYIEEINGNQKTVKIWTPEYVRTTSEDIDDAGVEETVVEDIVEENGLGTIPAVLAYNRRSMFKGIGVSDIADIADAQRAIYNCNSEIEQSVRLDSHPSLVLTPDTQAGIGAGSFIHMPENLDPGLKPYVLDFDGANIPNILQNISGITESIDKMANTGGVRATESRTLSGVALETEFQLLNSRLAEKSSNLELAEEHLWKLYAQYQDLQGKPDIDYPGSFNIRDNQGAMEQLVKAKSIAVDPAIHQIIDRELMELLGEDPEDVDAVMEHPTLEAAEKTPHIQQMIMEGYTDQGILDLHPEVTAQDIQTAKTKLIEQGDV